MHLDDNLKSVAEELGADFFGVADLSLAWEFILDQGGQAIAEYPRAVSIGIALLSPIVDQLPNRAEKAMAIEYRHHAYDIINERLDHITSRLGSMLQQSGHRAFPVPASKRADNTRICAIFSHKLAAHLAGLGWIGKSCLLITPERGPRVRWATILTDAPLEPTGREMEERCKDCQECVQVCPVGAFTGRPFRKEEPRKARYDARKCEQYHAELEKMMGIGVCGMCLYVCPFGRTKAEDLASNIRQR